MNAFTKATAVYDSTKDEAQYLERTLRNHFWVGGEAGQKRIRKLKIAVAGLGGMGSNIAEALVRVGVGHLRIADPDHIERSNFNRQVIANRNTLKKGKAASSAAELRAIADDFELVVYSQGVEEEMVDEFVKGCDAIVDEIDVYPLDRHVALHRAANRYGIPIYSAYVVGLGIHFYKFQGNEYTFEDFMADDRWKNPNVDFIYERFAPPVPSYLNAETIEGYKAEIGKGATPIFGPATLLGHSLVTTRVFLDLLGKTATLPKFEPTPVMPDYLVLDPCEFSFRRAKVPNTTLTRLSRTG